MATPLATHFEAADLAHYREHGFVRVPELLSPAEVERYRARARAIALGDHPPESASRIMRDLQFAKGLRPLPADPEHALWKIMNPDRFDACFAECLRLPQLLDAVAQLIGDDLLAFLLMVIYKPPGVPEAVHPFHQDGVFFPFEPHDLVVGAWIPLDPVDADNGTLCVVPGSHRLPVTGHEAVGGVNKFSLSATGIEGNAEVLARAHSIEAAPGDCVLFHPHLYHRTGGNRTARHRRVITVHFANARCRANAPSLIREFGFQSVRGRTYEGCLSAVDAPDLGFRL